MVRKDWFLLLKSRTVVDFLKVPYFAKPTFERFSINSTHLLHVYDFSSSLASSFLKKKCVLPKGGGLKPPF